MKLEDQQRFEVDAEMCAEMWLSCERCNWGADIEGPITLAELNRRADEHTEVCR